MAAPPSLDRTIEDSDGIELLGAVLGVLESAVLVFDARGTLRYGNPAGLRACNSLTESPSIVSRIIDGTQPARFELSCPEEARTQWLEWTHRPLRHPRTGEPLFLCTGVDVTERKRAQEALHDQNHLLQTLIDALPNPLFYKTVDGLYRGCNRAFEQMLGISREGIVGKIVYDLSPKELADVYFAKDRELFENPGVQIYEASVRYATGEVRNCIYYKATYNDLAGNLAGLVGIFLDITDRKKAELALADARDALEQRVRERTAELAEERDRAEAADRTKTEFLNIAAHELRTPLTTLHLTVHQVARDMSLGRSLSPERLARIDRQVSRLTRMVAELLDMSRLERGVLQLKPVRTELRALVTEVVDELRPLAGAHPVSVRVPNQELAAMVDPDRIRQVISNLIDNAFKYSPPEAEVEITLTAIHGGRARIEVRDSGPALAAEHRARLFAPFVRLQSSHHQEGLGLGLYISHATARQHGGTLRLVSEPGDGNRFALEIPQEAPTDVPAGAEPM